MKVLKIQNLMLLLFMCVSLFPSNTFAQEKKKVKKQVIIVKKTIDKEGKEVIEKTIQEGEDIDIDALIKSAENEKGNVEVEVEVTTDGDAKKDNKKEVTVQVDGNEVKIMSGDEIEVINIQDKDGTQEIKTDDGKRIIIKRGSGEDLDIGEMMQEIEVDMTEGGNKEIRIIKMEGSQPDENGAFFGVMIDPSAEGMELLNVVDGSPAQKAGMQRGDILRSINGKPIKSYQELTEVLSQFKPNDTIEVMYDRNQKSNKVNTKLVRRGDVASSKKMIWKTEDGEEIEIDDEEELHFHGKDKKGKVKKEKIIIKKKIKKEKE